MSLLGCVLVSSFFKVAYLVGFKPWDSGIPPPELVEVVEGPQRLEPGRALDLGCGTGTNCIYLAQHGWDVTGVDVVGRALNAARRKAAGSAVKPRFMKGDVTRLDDLNLGAAHELILDLGCFHSLPEERRDAYVAGVTAAAAPGATMLLFGFLDGPRRWPRPPGLRDGEIERRFGSAYDLVWERRSEPGPMGVGAWYRLRRRA
jgi:SAM-dependent methyltransferase